MFSLCACGSAAYDSKCETAFGYMENMQYEEAIAEFAAAIEHSPEKAVAYVGQGDAYTAIALQIEDDISLKVEAYQNAKASYESALELDETNVELIQKLANVYTELEEDDSAVSLLEQGYTATNDETLKETKVQLEEQMEKKRLRSMAQGVLSEAPYYGDLSKCNMSVEQAIAYAQLLADGLSGEMTDEMADSLYDKGSTVYWDNPYVCFAGYTTDRSEVILGDFAGDGNPYLYVSSSKIGNSFDIYGWNGESYQWCYEEERARDFWQSELNCDYETGTVEIILSRSGGVEYGVPGIYRFEAGNVIEIPETSEEYGESMPQIGEEQTWNLPFRKLSEVNSKPATLKEMISYLNDYAAKLSNGTAPQVKIPEISQSQLASREITKKMAETDNIRYSKIIDMNGDGVDELILGWDDTSATQYVDQRRTSLFKWNGGKLKEVSIMVGESIALCRCGNEYVIKKEDLGVGSFSGYEFIFVDRIESFSSGSEGDEAPTKYWYNQKSTSREKYYERLNNFLDKCEHVEWIG